MAVDTHRIGLRVADRLRTADAAYQRFVTAFQEWRRSPAAPQLQTLVNPGNPSDPDYTGEQHLECIAFSPPTQLDRLAARIADVVHPVRTAFETVERQKRVLNLGSAWPLTEPIWETIRRVDNLGKHEGAMDLELSMADAVVTVHDRQGGPPLARLEANPTPGAVPDFARAAVDDIEGFGVTRVASIPEAWHGEFYFRVVPRYELRFGDKTGPQVRGLVVNDVLIETLKASRDLLKVLGIERPRT